MKFHFVKYVLLSALAITPVGCEPRPVVVDPNDNDTTVIEDDADLVIPDTTPNTDIDVGVGEPAGTDVNINSDGAGTGTTTNQNANPNQP